MKVGAFEFNLRELAGSMGDFGTLFPLAIGYIAVCGLPPAGMFVMMGLANIATGLLYRLPMPIEPMKVLAVVAIAQHWSPSMVYASGFAMGVIWLVFAATGVMGLVARFTPRSVVIGIQVALGVLLAVEAVKMVATGWLLGLACVVVVLVLRKSRVLPAAIVLMALGAAAVFVEGGWQSLPSPRFALPGLATFRGAELWQTLVLAGFAQLPLTATNAVIATSSLIKTYWPDRPVTEQRLSWNMGILNAVLPLFGGMPLCHGAGGLAGQYFFGARTGGTNLIEGALEILVGLFLADSIAGLLTAFPVAIIGAMMLLVGLELVKFARNLRSGTDVVPMAATVVASLAWNMAIGFLAGVAVHHLARSVARKRARA